MGLQILRVVYPLGGIPSSFTNQEVTLERLVWAMLEGIFGELFGKITGIRPDRETGLGTS